MIKLLGTRDPWALSQLCVDHIQYSKNQYLAMLEVEESSMEQGIRRSDAKRLFG
jgi:hypothetical protein